MQRLTAQDITDKNNLIKSQQDYLKHINDGGYKQEANTFFDSYDAHTTGWNNVFTRRYNNQVMEDRNAKQREANVGIKAQNELTKAKNEKTKAKNERNKRMEDRNNRLEGELNQGLTAGNKSVALPKSSKLTINTGMGVEATKLSDALLKDNGLSL